MFANLITLAHFPVSSTMILPKSVGDPPSTVPPKSAIRDMILRSTRAALISLLSIEIISAGVSLADKDAVAFSVAQEWQHAREGERFDWLYAYDATALQI